MVPGASFGGFRQLLDGTADIAVTVSGQPHRAMILVEIYVSSSRGLRTMSTKCGISIPQTFEQPGVNVELIRKFVVRAEALGYDSLWV
jgi:hypothetical protein